MKASAIKLIVFAACLLTAFTAHAGRAKAQILYKNNMSLYASPSGSIYTFLNRTQDYRGTRGYCESKAYIVTNGRRARNPVDRTVRTGRTRCNNQQQRITVINICEIKGRAVDTIVRSDTGEYLGQIKYKVTGCP